MDGGAGLCLHTKAVKILVERGNAIGVEAKRFGRTARYYGKTIVLSAGAANVELLRQAGIQEAGAGFCLRLAAVCRRNHPAGQHSSGQPDDRRHTGTL